MLVVDSFDYDRILPRCRAVVHHGGSGTPTTSCEPVFPPLSFRCLPFRRKPADGPKKSAGSWLPRTGVTVTVDEVDRLASTAAR